jgi:hypothetical protein
MPIAAVPSTGNLKLIMNSIAIKEVKFLHPQSLGRPALERNTLTFLMHHVIASAQFNPGKIGLSIDSLVVFLATIFVFSNTI